MGGTTSGTTGGATGGDSGGTTGGEPRDDPDGPACGNDIVDQGEQCDDGDLESGDGCSNVCTIEECGNEIVEEIRGEQCDDGNEVTGDGCSAACLIEYCGDGYVQELIGEQCDDANAINGDGCSDACLLEEPEVEMCDMNAQRRIVMNRAINVLAALQTERGRRVYKPLLTLDEWAFLREMVTRYGEELQMPCEDFETLQTIVRKLVRPLVPFVPPVEPPIVPMDAPTPTDEEDVVGEGDIGSTSRCARDLQTSQSFLLSESGREFLSALPSSSRDALSRAVGSLCGTSLDVTEEEKRALFELAIAMEKERVASQQEVTTLLQRLFTPIGTDVLVGYNLSKERLIGVTTNIARDELGRAVGTIDTVDLLSATNTIIAALHRQGIRISTDSPAYRLLSDGDPLRQFAGIVALKELAEADATESIPGSAAIIAEQVAKLKSALPYLEASHGIDRTEVGALLDLIAIRAETVRTHNTEPFVATVNRLVTEFRRSGFIDATESETIALDLSKAVARAESLTRTYAPRLPMASLLGEDSSNLMQGLSLVASRAPEEVRTVLVEGTDEERKEAILTYLTTNERIASMRDTLEERGTPDDDVYASLLACVRRVDKAPTDASLCDDSLESAVQSANIYIDMLESSVRSRTMWTRFIGYVQDVLFGA